MTNEDKLREIFPKTIFIYHKEDDKTAAIQCSDEWLNAEYEEPTTKNDLGVEHHEQNIKAYAHDFGVSEEQAEKELRVTIKNDLGVDCIKKSDAINIIQDMHGLARVDVISDAVNRIIAMPSVTLQEPIIDKIRAEILEEHESAFAREDADMAYGLSVALDILDKYRADTEDT